MSFPCPLPLTLWRPSRQSQARPWDHRSVWAVCFLPWCCCLSFYSSLGSDATGRTGCRTTPVNLAMWLFFDSMWRQHSSIACHTSTSSWALACRKRCTEKLRKFDLDLCRCIGSSHEECRGRKMPKILARLQQLFSSKNALVWYTNRWTKMQTCTRISG